MFGLEDELQAEIEVLKKQLIEKEGSILSFRSSLKKLAITMDGVKILGDKFTTIDPLEAFDKHFGITTERMGKIN